MCNLIQYNQHSPELKYVLASDFGTMSITLKLN